LEAFYGLNEVRDMSPTEKLRELASLLRSLCGDIQIPPGGSVTFVIDELPYGFAFPEFPRHISSNIQISDSPLSRASPPNRRRRAEQTSNTLAPSDQVFSIGTSKIEVPDLGVRQLRVPPAEPRERRIHNDPSGDPVGILGRECVANHIPMSWVTSATF
jgi:hypothetical protein